MTVFSSESLDSIRDYFLPRPCAAISMREISHGLEEIAREVPDLGTTTIRNSHCCSLSLIHI